MLRDDIYMNWLSAPQAVIMPALDGEEACRLISILATVTAAKNHERNNELRFHKTPPTDYTLIIDLGQLCSNMKS